MSTNEVRSPQSTSLCAEASVSAALRRDESARQEVHSQCSVANTFDPDQTRSSDGTFSADAFDATSAAHKATAEAYSEHTAEAHERAARLHRVAAMRQAE